MDRGTGPFDIVLPTSIVEPDAGSVAAVGRINRSIREFVATALASGDKPLVLSGDCLGCIGCLAGLEAHGLRPPLLWFDAHGDFHTSTTTISGHLGGMSLAMITGRGDLSLLETAELTPLPDTQVCHIGARDLERGEREAFEASGIRRAQRVTEILEDLSPQVPPWVHFDTDYIDPSDAPAMRYPSRGGPSAQTVAADLRSLAQKTPISGLSISAWAPHLDRESRTAAICWHVLAALRNNLQQPADC